MLRLEDPLCLQLNHFLHLLLVLFDDAQKNFVAERLTNEVTCGYSQTMCLAGFCFVAVPGTYILVLMNAKMS